VINKLCFELCFDWGSTWLSSIGIIDSSVFVIYWSIQGSVRKRLIFWTLVGSTKNLFAISIDSFFSIQPLITLLELKNIIFS